MSLSSVAKGSGSIEIKGRPGRVEGDVGTWTWTTLEGRRFTDDNPIYLANKKAKALSHHPQGPAGVSERSAFPSWSR